MVGLDHGAQHPAEQEDPVAVARNARVGLILFFIYLAFYAGFVMINTLAPAMMEPQILGVNLAIWYGVTLIIAALVLAGIYGFLTRK